MTTREEMIKEKEYHDRLSETIGICKAIKVDGHPTGYLVSSTGKIMKNSNRNILSFVNQLTTRYKKFSIIVDKKRYNFSVHRLVAIAFCEIPKRYLDVGLSYDDLVVNHIDGIKSHNAAFNLEWVTTQENTYHAWNTGLCSDICGEKNHLSKISEKVAIRICDLIMERNNNNKILDILEKEGTPTTVKTVQHIRAGECWKHITKNYDFPKLGTAKPNSIPETTVRKVCSLLEKKKYTDTAIAKECGVKREYVKEIHRHHIQTKISKDYDF